MTTYLVTTSQDYTFRMIMDAEQASAGISVELDTGADDLAYSPTPYQTADVGGDADRAAQLAADYIDAGRVLTVKAIDA